MEVARSGMHPGRVVAPAAGYAGMGTCRAVGSALALAGAALTIWSGIAGVTATASLPRAGNSGDVWVSEHDDFDKGGHGMDPHIDCSMLDDGLGPTALMDVWGAGLASPSGTLTIIEWSPTGDGTTVDYGPAPWSYAGTGPSRIAIVDMRMLVRNALRNGDVPQATQGLHLKLVVQPGGKQKVFWLRWDCSAPGTSATSGSTSAGGASTAATSISGAGTSNAWTESSSTVGAPSGTTSASTGTTRSPGGGWTQGGSTSSLATGTASTAGSSSGGNSSQGGTAPTATSPGTGPSSGSGSTASSWTGTAASSTATTPAASSNTTSGSNQSVQRSTTTTAPLTTSGTGGSSGGSGGATSGAGGSSSGGSTSGMSGGGTSDSSGGSASGVNAGAPAGSSDDAAARAAAGSPAGSTPGDAAAGVAAGVALAAPSADAGGGVSTAQVTGLPQTGADVPFAAGLVMLFVGLVLVGLSSRSRRLQATGQSS